MGVPARLPRSLVIERDDRFGDLGGGAGDGRSAAQRLEERDRTHPEPVDKRPEVPRPGNKYAWVVGIVMLMVLIVLLTQTIPNSGEGLQGPEPGRPLPQFAAPLVTGDVEGDANVRQPNAGGEQAGAEPACEIDTRGVLTSCEYEDRPVVLAFVFDRGAECNPFVDKLERISADFPGVNFLAVYFSRKDRGELRELVERRGWSMPVAVDRDGAVANLYRVGGCPTTVLAREGGRVARTLLGERSEEQLRRSIGRIAG